MRADELPELNFTADGVGGFWAIWKPAQTRTVTVRAALINNTEPRRFIKVDFGEGGVLCRFFLLALAMLLVGSLYRHRSNCTRSATKF